MPFVRTCKICGKVFPAYPKPSKCPNGCEDDPRYADNTVHWKPGDIVIHRADAKRRDMLMKVVGYHRETGYCETVYLFAEMAESPRSFKDTNEIWHNDIKHLLDPVRFGIDTTL